MKILSWNVNGIRSALKKGFTDYINAESPDIFCLQETKASQDQVVLELPQYKSYWNSATRKGYSGTAIFTKNEPINITYGILKNGKLLEMSDKYGDANKEGRVVATEFANFILVTVYTPNSKGDLSRLEFRHKVWDPYFLDYVNELRKIKPVIFCGDLNVAHEEIDLARPDTNHNSHGFTAEEREGFSNIVSAGFVDSFRHLYPNEPGKYTWWSPFGGARQRNIGWRIDYFVVAEELKDAITEATIAPEVTGSDHCPVIITLDLD